MLSQFCMSSEGQCRVLEDDLEAAYQLRETFPDQVLLVRFEDLIEDAERQGPTRMYYTKRTRMSNVLL